MCELQRSIEKILLVRFRRFEVRQLFLDGLEDVDGHPDPAVAVRFGVERWPHTHEPLT